MDFFAAHPEHGVLLLLACAFWPRLVVAVLALAYWPTDPVLVILAWVACFSAASLNASATASSLSGKKR